MEKFKRILKIVITVALPCIFIWFLVLSPYLRFKNDERVMEDAAKRYFQINSHRLPTGKRVSTVKLQTLFDESYVKSDFYIPFSKEPCSVTDSWVKVRQNENAEYEYYTYLQCGVFKSSVDATGPVITLNGDKEITLNIGDQYREAGVKSVKDNKDGKMDVASVTIDSSKVDTSKIGSYEVSYTALDDLKNKTTVTRKVNVVQRLNTTVKQAVGEGGIYKGTNVNNFIYLSGMVFRIIGMDGDNVKIVSDVDIANVNYDAIDKWLDYFYEHLSDKSKKYLVKNTYCYGSLTSDNANSDVSCSKKTKERLGYIISSKELNESRDEYGESYLFPQSMNWTSDVSLDDNSVAWATKFSFVPVAPASQFLMLNKDYNLGIRPVLTLKGDALLQSGDGSVGNPYSLGDIDKGKADDYLNTRITGEYITYSSYLWRIMETTNDGYTKVVSESPITNDMIGYQTDDDAKIYNPNQRGNIGYEINKRTSNTLNDKLFITKEITVPIYKELAKYGEEVEEKKYKVKFAAPNLYEMFSAPQVETSNGYWLINSSKKEYCKYAVSNVGVVFYEPLDDNFETYIRPVGYLDSKVKIVSGKGTRADPYKISK